MPASTGAGALPPAEAQPLLLVEGMSAGARGWGAMLELGCEGWLTGGTVEMVAADV